MVGRFKETPGMAIDNDGKSFWVNWRKDTTDSTAGEYIRERSGAVIFTERR
jgi:hypothetical protein